MGPERRRGHHYDLVCTYQYWTLGEMRLGAELALRLMDGARAYRGHSGEVGRCRDVAKSGTSGLNDGVAIIMI